MNIKNKTFAIAALLLVAGTITAVMSFEPSEILRYIFIGVSLGTGALGVRIAQEVRSNFVRSRYYLWIAYTLVAFAISLGIWATTIGAFIYVLGFFLLVLGIIEFVFVQQVLSYESPVPWALVGTKILISTITAVGAGLILTVGESNPNAALLCTGVLLVLVALAFAQVATIAKRSEQATA